MKEKEKTYNLNVTEDYKQYISDLEFAYYDSLTRNVVDPLLKSMQENKDKNYFNFISETNFTCLGKINLKADKCEKRVIKQKAEFRKIINALNFFAKKPISEELAQHFYGMVLHKLFKPTVELGYTEEACELLKLVKNPEIMKEYASKSIDEEILQVVQTFAKRVVLEGTPDIEDQVDIFMVDVVATKDYGTDTKLTLDSMLDVYENTEVKLGDVVCKVGQKPEIKKSSILEESKTLN